ncbi:23S rRNA pseudouridine(2605) synthase RluB [Kangiella sediminilitoris]|uniref:Pseudouridine synthase n=1 Tax=Kangiella sediminilitoris TaxID=1144748 RepID=A0A1B3BBP3_9GAMM|nr:pseudouridine synthase [Kangiella sediminilitoris]AOE50208.1 RNA pseudouridine synthase [Kangiella sediminilitoris]
MSKNKSEKLQKILANAGLGSRREIEKWIAAGRVSVNGSIAELGERATDKDTIRVDGRVIKIKPSDEVYTRIIAYHKPLDEVSTQKDPEGRPTVFDKLPNTKFGRWISIGRLDINTTGLLLFTNNGELAHRLMHPSYQVERKYAVRIHGQVTDEMLDNLKSGVLIDGDMCNFNYIQPGGGEGSNQWYEVGLSEGKNREVRKLWMSQGVDVSRLIRVQYGPIELPKALSRGRWMDLSEEQIKQVADLVDLEVQARKSQPKKRSTKNKNIWKKTIN